MNVTTGLTEDERHALALTAELYDLIARKIIVSGPTRQQDTAELAADIHRIQARIGAQAAARAHPDLYRLMGDTIR